MDPAQEFDCGAVLDISIVTQWREQALAVLDTGVALELNGENLQRIDAAGLQALLGLVMAAEQKSIPLKWVNPSTVLQQAAELIGLHDDLRLG